MPIPLRTDFDAMDLRSAARRTKHAGQARRLLALAAVYNGATRTEAAKIGGVTLQIVRDWVIKLNAHGPDGLIDGKAPGQPCRLNDTHRRALAEVINSGPIPAIHGVVRWRIIDLCQWLWDEFQIRIAKQTLSRELRAMGFRKLSARPRHHAQAAGAIEVFKRMARPVRKCFFTIRLSSLRQRIRPKARPWPRWRSARPGPHKTLGVERHFLNQVSRTPFDCRAISLPPLANIVSPSTHHLCCPADS